MKTLSVIIPVYHPGAELADCLNALARQTFKNFEIILVLNGSEEEDKAYCDYLIGLHPELDIMLLVLKGAGVSNARNYGLEKASGEYVAFIDADDLISERYFEGFLSAKGNKSIVFSDVMTFVEKPGDLAERNLFHSCYTENRDKKDFSMMKIRRLMNGPWGKLYRRSDLKDIRFNPKLHTNEDALFNFIFSRKIQTIGFTPEYAIYYYRINPNGVTMRKRSGGWYLKNALRLSCLFTAAYLRYFPRISFPYYLTRLAANCKYALTGLRNS